MKKMKLMTAALLLVSGLVTAGEVKLPEPQSGLLALPRGFERTVHLQNAPLRGGAKQSTEVGISCDSKDLVAVFRCEDERIVAAQGKGRDNPDSWKDDCVELLLDPGHRHGVPTLIRVTAAGALWDARGADTSYNIEGLKSRVVRTDNGWRGRIEIPWQGLGVKAPGDGEVWGLNLRRIDQNDDASLKTMAESAWTPVPQTDAQNMLSSAHMVFVQSDIPLPAAEYDSLRRKVAEENRQAIRAWAGPNNGDVISLAGKPVIIPQLGRVDSGVSARQATRVTVDRNAEALIVSFDCTDADITTAQEGRDNTKLWKDDCVYVWLDPAHDHKDLIMVQVSASGVVHDAKAGDSKWTLDGLIADTKKTDRGWTATITIPFKGLGVAAPPLTPHP